MRRLIDYAFAAGCAGKACQEDLFAILKKMPRFYHRNLLVGAETFDDAGIYRLDNRRALVLTVDVLTPVANDPYVFGQIAAANSLSDVYAMGGEPVAALSVLGLPVDKIEHKTIRNILKGAWGKVQEAGAVIAGGHTFKDREVKFGLAVVGLVHPRKVITNAGAKPGDRLILTKPLGTGVITTALKANWAPERAVTEANRFMGKLNNSVAQAMSTVGVDAATDITGFGLLGHAWEMARASGVEIVIEAARVPLIDGVQELAAKGYFPLGTLNNYEFIKSRADFPKGLSKDMRLVLCDAQTSGGLLIAVPVNREKKLLQLLHRNGVREAKEIGYVQKGRERVKVVI